MFKLSESARERELYRYYQPDSLPGNLNHGGCPPVRQSSNDLSLTAFAQLGALRLGARRGLITLATRSTEYVIAEAGKTQSLQDDSRHDEDDGLWHGVGALTDKKGMASVMLDSLYGTGPDRPSQPYVVVYDLSKDDRFKETELVRCPPYLRFMACFPIISPGMHVIGFYIVVDDKPREELTQSEIQFLIDMSATVMDHLKSASVRKKQYRAARMVKALGLFIEGKSTMRDWWMSQGGYNIQQSKPQNNTPKTILDREADIEFGVQEPADGYFARDPENTHQRVQHPELFTSPLVAMGNSHGIERPSMHHINSVDSSTSTIEPSTIASVSEVGDFSVVSGLDSTVATALDSGISTPYTGLDSFEDTTASLDVTSARNVREALVSSDSKRAFSKAANLIREGLGLDGAIFYDANVGYFSNSPSKSQEKASPVATGSKISETTSSSEEDSLGTSNNKTSTSAPSSLTLQRADESAKDRQKVCQILGYSTRTRSSVNTHPPMNEHASLLERVLRRLLKRYPNGKVFYFAEDGSFSSSDSDRNNSTDGCSTYSTISSTSVKDDQSPSERKKRISREEEAAALLKALPGVRSAVFYPLWHPSKERWVAGSLIWTTSPMRVLCPVEDMLYMAAFGNSIVAELSRLSALLAAQMKIDFTSSISHELRSPLHGVLASVEFLQETPMTEMQTDMVNTIHSCGKTLLDTVNHVLDFSKVNERVKGKSGAKNQPRKSSNISRRRKMSVATTSEDMTDISILAEEVIDSVYAGHSIGKRPYRPTRMDEKTTLGAKTSHWTLQTAKPQVTIITDIAWRSNWEFGVDTGALRRILMNIFNNSMKYTETGFVRVSLNTEDNLVSRNGTAKSILSLTVADSGKGISQDFLKNHLYTPFAQEDALAAGTGLGLSIVRKIVRDLGGTITFTSEQGAGTEARLAIPIAPNSTDITDSGDRNIISEVREKIKGLKTCLVGFDAYPDIMDTPTGILSAEAEAAISLKASFSSVMADWFCMEIIASSGSESSDADLYVILESSVVGKQNIEEKVRALSNCRAEGSGTPKVLLLCNASSQTHTIDIIQGIQVFCIRQPYGPHKLSKVLHQAFCLTPTELGNPKLEHINEVTESSNAPSLPAPVPSDETKGQVERTPGKELESPEPSSSRATELTEPPSDISKELKILLVEDNEINLKLLIAFMHKLGLKHSTATNGLEALNVYQDRSGEFDVIFMDISMPVMDGLTASREIRQFERRNNIPVTTIIALTGAASMAAQQEALRSGIDLFLTKPVPMKRLRKILKDFNTRGIAD